VADRHSGTTPDVNDFVAGSQAAQPYCEPRVPCATESHAERGDEPRDSGKSGVVRVVIGRRVLFGHTLTLTVEPDFKSSGRVSEPLLPIGEVAERAGVATSTIRYYERLNLLVADARTSGQRRYRVAALRRLVFIGMLQDAGLALVDIAGILDAADASEWKAIAIRRLEALDEEIATLVQARAYLSGALLCRYDHPATDCKIMGAEIDRRLSVSNEDE
jgi:DNA-binding transcriptional MerR regulator